MHKAFGTKLPLLRVGDSTMLWKAEKHRAAVCCAVLMWPAGCRGTSYVGASVPGY